MSRSLQLKKTGVFAVLACASVLTFGCLEGGGSLTNLPDTELAEVNLQIRLGRLDTESPTSGEVPMLKRSVDQLDSVGFSDSAERLHLRNMVLRFTSNLRDTLWDTLTPGTHPVLYDPGTEEDRALSVNVALKPLRWWNIEIKTHDDQDSVIHYAQVGPIPSRGGQSVTLDVPLITARYSLYEARYLLPEHVYPANVPVDQRVYQKIFFNRLVLSIDSAIVRDSSSLDYSLTSPGPRFITAGSALKNAEGAWFFRPSRAFPDTITHIQTYRYVRAGPRVFNIKAYGRLEGDSVGQPSRLLFEGSRTVTIEAGAAVPAIPIILDWQGGACPYRSDMPATPRDFLRRAGVASSSACGTTPGSPNWSGVRMEVIIGKVRKVTLGVDVGGNI